MPSFTTSGRGRPTVLQRSPRSAATSLSYAVTEADEGSTIPRGGVHLGYRQQRQCHGRTVLRPLAVTDIAPTVTTADHHRHRAGGARPLTGRQRRPPTKLMPSSTTNGSGRPTASRHSLILAATGLNYAVTEADEGATIRVEAFTSDSDNSASATANSRRDPWRFTDIAPTVTTPTINRHPRRKARR